MTIRVHPPEQGDELCKSLPLASSRTGVPFYSSFEWSASLPDSPQRCASLHDFINISIREDQFTGLMLRSRGFKTMTAVYESFLPDKGADSSPFAQARSQRKVQGAICALLFFLGLPCRGAKGKLLVSAGTTKIGSGSARDLLANFEEVADYLERRHMSWMLDL